MSHISLQSPPPRRKPEALVAALDRSRQALAADVPGHEREWAEKVEAALAGVEQALRQHMAVAATPDGVFAEVDDTRPTLARQADVLCQEHGDLLKQVLALREEVRRTAAAFQPAAGPTAKTAAGGVADFGVLRQQAEKLLAGLEQNKEAETKLVLESVTTDIGVGD
jgi:hypothetical protein